MRVSYLVSRVSFTLLSAASLSAQSVPAALLAPPDSLTDRTGYTAALRQLCPGMATDRNEMFKREREAARDAAKAQDSPTAWRAVACARAALDLDDAWSRESIEMTLGTPWQEGATTAALKAVSLDSTDRPAAQLLGVLVGHQAKPPRWRDVALALGRAATTGISTPAAVRGCVDPALRSGEADLARACLDAGLQAGDDSTWQLLQVARLAARMPDTLRTTTAFAMALATARDPGAWKEVGWHLHWFLEPEEWDEWLILSDSDRLAWVTDRIASRDVRDGNRSGARLVEHFTRLEAVDSQFRIHLERRQAGRVQVAATPENFIRQVEDVAMWWEPGLAPARPYREFARWDPRYDDRAVVYMRFGEPVTRLRWSGRDTTEKPNDSLTPRPVTNTREAWDYDLDGVQLLLSFESEQFVGSNEATRLVAGVLGHYFCSLNTLRCALSQQSKNAYAQAYEPGGSGVIRPLNPEVIEGLRTADLEYIAEATTEDDNSVRTEHHIATVATLSRVWDPASGATLAVIPYALRLGDLEVDKDSNATAIDLTLRQWNPATSAWQSTEITRRLRLPTSRDNDARVTGYLVVPSTDGVSAWSLVAGQGTDRLGRSFADRITPLRSGALAISDLVLGAGSQGQAWQTTGGRTVPLGPLGAYNREQPVAVYWQARSAEARATVRTTIRLLRTDRSGTDQVALEVATEGELGRGLTELQREVGVAQLDAGSYRLEVELTDLGDNVTVKRSARLLLN